MIDTLEFVRRMVESGMAEKTAEQLAHELREALPEGDVATKAFVKSELAQLRSELITEMEKLRTELRAAIAELRSEFQTDTAKLRGDLQSGLARMRSSIIVWVAIFVVFGQVLPSVLQFIRSLGHG
jgi:flagellar biosynthesis/type III secretory pathway protein FliH